LKRTDAQPWENGTVGQWRRDFKHGAVVQRKKWRVPSYGLHEYYFLCLNKILESSILYTNRITAIVSLMTPLEFQN